MTSRQPSSFERRQFISTLFGAGVAAAALGQEKKLSYKGENIQYGLVTYMWGADLDLPSLIETCDKAGILGVELRVEHAHKVDPTLTSPQRVEVRKRFEDAQVKLIGMGTNYEFSSADPDVVKKNIASAKEYIKLSHDIGGSGVKVKPNDLPKQVAKEKTLEQIGKSLAELADYALGFGQEIRLEVHGKVTDLSDVRTVMEAAKRDSVRVCWNSNDADLNGEGIEANFAKVKDFLGHTLHMREANDSKYPYKTLAKLLVEADFDGYTCLEAHSKIQGDRVEALIKQRELWMGMVRDARMATA
ncbi:MAG: Sugar phosphate isomerase/epimerase [Verrucomicrobiaceae bacterium]|nr:Sugar phosphate isomerase/epimerase [Verrucomicrobiaceae bacterium]MDB6118265.1 Sugar phosphate isomerase/epimerase [Verrucomicrobiaceae bacterium]